MNRKVFAIIAIAMLVGSSYADKTKAWTDAKAAHAKAVTAEAAASTAKKSAADAHSVAAASLAALKAAYDAVKTTDWDQAKKDTLATRATWKATAEKLPGLYSAFVTLADKVGGSDVLRKAWETEVQKDAAAGTEFKAITTTKDKMTKDAGADPKVPKDIAASEEAYWTALEKLGLKYIEVNKADPSKTAFGKISDESSGTATIKAAGQEWAKYATGVAAATTDKGKWTTDVGEEAAAKKKYDETAAVKAYVTKQAEVATLLSAKETKSTAYDEAKKALSAAADLVASEAKLCGTACAATTGTGTATATTTACPTGTATATATATATTTGTRRLTTTTTATTATTAATTTACPGATATTTGASASHASIMLALTALILSRFFK